ncbi:MAG: 50S ribosomal protein L24 [Candidatus Omnitrophica bacterium]|nr:50S ribosomal protein L24 [Candidatus Omnitrophota bacterium]
MLKIRRGDTVQVIKGKDKGKKGNIIKIFQKEGRALVQGINLFKKHKRKTRQDQQGGIVTIESPVSICNLMFFCKHCSKASRIGFRMDKDKTKSRFCKACQETV